MKDGVGAAGRGVRGRGPVLAAGTPRREGGGRPRATVLAAGTLSLSQALVSDGWRCEETMSRTDLLHNLLQIDLSLAMKITGPMDSLCAQLTAAS